MRRRFASESYIASQEAIKRASADMVNLSSLSEMICDRKGVIKKATPVTTEEEHILYKHLSIEAQSTEHLATLWNDVVLDALISKKEQISIVEKNTKKEIDLQVSKLFLKDSRHFELHQSQDKKEKEVFLQFNNATHFSSFRSTRLQTRYTEAVIPAIAPTPLRMISEEENEAMICGDESSTGSGGCTSQTSQNNAKRKKAKTCSHCPSNSRRHQSNDPEVQNCPLHLYYKRRKNIPINRRRKETVYDAIEREYITLVQQNLGR